MDGASLNGGEAFWVVPVEATCPLGVERSNSIKNVGMQLIHHNPIRMSGPAWLKKTTQKAKM